MCSNAEDIVRQLRSFLDGMKENAKVNQSNTKIQSFEQVERRIDSLEEALLNVAVLLLLCIGLAAIFYRDYQRQRQQHVIDSNLVWTAFAAPAATPAKSA